MSKRGAPTKEQRVKNKHDKNKADLALALAEGNATIIENYVDYLTVLDDIALGRVASATPASRISAANILIKKVEELKEELEIEAALPEGSSEVEEVVGEEELEHSLDNILSLEFTG
ncbi:hypothetical protein [Vibrio phage RYC]|nr:hypothetical protein [Vibrio phage RYC]